MPSLEELDAAWLRAARQRAAAGSWEREPGEVLAALADAPRAAAPPGAIRCPACPAPPPLAPYRRPGGSPLPVHVCETCWGAWVPDAIVAAGIPPDAVPPAVAAAGPAHGGSAPAAQPARPCPACSSPMEHIPAAGAVLDRCPACRSTWFDTGELAAVYGMVPLVSDSTASADAPDGSPVPAWQVVLDLALLLIAPHLRLRRFF
ncbi:zf-TFIIB domain-containing protein [Tepidiforma thermophila]|uniref:TFIIB-like protein n=1 Tax=Tepidiforma thermophila (strain KCTC 52669 / CGMCC 1.13589 / G233) TaxID=2761530 RepID=A0A2A9HFI2_TEPT2|nr:zf-TFIIB domain-containing protein [Tepidiforma thermophila]PFG73901.1 TFIIB-like protein [Tepidiforma thermophila]